MIRLILGLGCLTAIAFAGVEYANGQEKNALIAGALAILLAISRIDFLGLGRIIQSQATSEWQASKGRLFFAVVVLAIGVGLALFAKVYYVENLGPPNEMSAYGVTAGLISLFVIIFGLKRLFGVLWRLSGSLVPTGRPNLDTVTKQKVHGQAGYAAADQVDAALRDQDHGAGGAPHFRD